MPRLPVALHVPLSAIPASTGGRLTPMNAPTPLQELTNEALSLDYDGVSVSLTTPAWKARWERLCLRPVEGDFSSLAEELEDDQERGTTEVEAEKWRNEGGFRKEELSVTRLGEAERTIAFASDWLELDSPDEGIRFDSELALRAELSQALHLNIPVLILPAPKSANRAHLASYARAISSLLLLGGPSAYTQLSLLIPVSDPIQLISQGPAPPGTSEDKKHRRVSSLSHHQQQRPQSMASSIKQGAHSQGDPSATWEMWDMVRKICGYNPRLSLTLDLSNPLPPSVGALSRWTAEPTRHIFLPAVQFIPNAKGYPVLSKACQAFLKGIAKHNPTVILSQTREGRHGTGGAKAYLQYVRYIESAVNTAQGAAGEQIKGYGDWLQAPLQPLMDDLGSATYEVFERDPVKYSQYEQAVYLALCDRPQGPTYVIYVVGAGRGPLVAGCLSALEKSGRKGKVYAVEKNANAFVTLQERKELEWGAQVELIFGDMRNIDVRETADIMVSELLGSFGDNELSPECLDGAMRVLKPDGISIPASYTAHLSPISSSKLHNEVTASTRQATAAETPYVVMFQQVNTLSGDPRPGSFSGGKVQECWMFEHPRRDLVLDEKAVPLTNSHNTRSALLTFTIPHAGALTGLAGYFECHLYGDVGLSIHPERMHRISPDMQSWFPLFFPFKEPLYLPSGCELDVHIWRLTDPRTRKVWYEWHAEAFLPLPPGALPSATSMANTANGGTRHPSGASYMTAGGQPSPMMDAQFSPNAPLQAAIGNSGSEGNRLKIGQTALHNPGGRSSWIGL